MAMDWILLACGASVVITALVAGVFLAFSDFIMRSLARADTKAGIEVMQIVNREVHRTLFLVLLLGMSVAAPVLAGYAAMALGGAGARWIAAGAALYVIGVFLVTVLGNVPMNIRLDRMVHDSPETAAYWREIYRPRWTAWNTVRALAAGGSAVCFLMAGLTLMQTG